MLDRMRAQVAFWYDRDGVTQGELRYQRESHRRLDAKVVRLETREAELTNEKARLSSEIAQLHARLSESQRAQRGLRSSRWPTPTSRSSA